MCAAEKAQRCAGGAASQVAPDRAYLVQRPLVQRLPRLARRLQPQEKLAARAKLDDAQNAPCATAALGRAHLEQALQACQAAVRAAGWRPVLLCAAVRAPKGARCLALLRPTMLRA